MHEQKWSLALSERWTFEKIIIDIANQKVRQVWKKDAKMAMKAVGKKAIESIKYKKSKKRALMLKYKKSKKAMKARKGTKK